MRHDSQLELPVVRDDELIPLLAGERLSDLVDVLVESRLVQQVWLSRRETPCLGVDIYRAVDSPVLVRQLNERADEGLQERLQTLQLHQAVYRGARLLRPGLPAFLPLLLVVVPDLPVLLLLDVSGQPLQDRRIYRGESGRRQFQ